MTRSALHHVDVFDGDRSAVAVEDDENCKPDRGFGGSDGQNEQREDLPDEAVQEGGKRDQVESDRQKYGTSAVEEKSVSESVDHGVSGNLQKEKTIDRSGYCVLYQSRDFR